MYSMLRIEIWDLGFKKRIPAKVDAKALYLAALRHSVNIHLKGRHWAMYLCLGGPKELESQLGLEERFCLSHKKTSNFSYIPE